MEHTDRLVTSDGESMNEHIVAWSPYPRTAGPHSQNFLGQS